MSFVTTVILIFPGSEHEDERMKEVNSFLFKGAQLDLRSIKGGDKTTHAVWFGGTKDIKGCIYVGSYNYFEIGGFLRHVSTVKWEDPEYVQILIQKENEWNYSLYGMAGRELIYKAKEQ